MSQTQQEYAKKSFDNVGLIYDEISFFKISAKHMLFWIKKIKIKDKCSKKISFLDMACGTGNVVIQCAYEFNNSIFDAIDISLDMIQIAKKNALKNKLTNINFKIQDIKNIPLDKKYDIITCSYAMFFLPNVVDVFKKTLKILKKDGIFLFTTFLNKSFLPSSDILLTLLIKCGSKSAKEYDKNKWQNLTNKDDIKYLCKQAEANNFKIITKEIRYNLSIDKWWELFNNTGFKGMIMELDRQKYDYLKINFYKQMNEYANENNEVELIADSYFVIIKQ
jgi:ubiquinone/menaquinone biosynthesis C-methylase UbiE